MDRKLKEVQISKPTETWILQNFPSYKKEIEKILNNQKSTNENAKFIADQMFKLNDGSYALNKSGINSIWNHFTSKQKTSSVIKYEYKISKKTEEWLKENMPKYFNEVESALIKGKKTKNKTADFIIERMKLVDGEYRLYNKEINEIKTRFLVDKAESILAEHNTKPTIKEISPKTLEWINKNIPEKYGEIKLGLEKGIKSDDKLIDYIVKNMELVEGKYRLYYDKIKYIEEHFFDVSRERKTPSEKSVIVKKFIESKPQKEIELSLTNEQKLRYAREMVDFYNKYEESLGRKPALCATFISAVSANLGIGLPNVSTWYIPREMNKANAENVTDHGMWFKDLYKSSLTKDESKIKDSLDGLLKNNLINQNKYNELKKMLDERNFSGIQKKSRVLSDNFFNSLPDGSHILIRFARSTFVEEAGSSGILDAPTHTIIKINGKWEDYARMIGKQPVFRSFSNSKMTEYLFGKNERTFGIIPNEATVRFIYSPPKPLQVNKTKIVRVPSLDNELKSIFNFINKGEEISNEIYGNSGYKWFFASQLFSSYKKGLKYVELEYPVYRVAKTKTNEVRIFGEIKPLDNDFSRTFVEEIKNKFKDLYEPWQYELFGHQIGEEMFSKRKDDSFKKEIIGLFGSLFNYEKMIAAGTGRTELKRFLEKEEFKLGFTLEKILQNPEGEVIIKNLSVGVVQTRPDPYIDWMHRNPDTFRKMLSNILENSQKINLNKNEIESIKIIINMSNDEMKRQRIPKELGNKYMRTLIDSTFKYEKEDYAYMLFHCLIRDNEDISVMMYMDYANLMKNDMLKYAKKDVDIKDLGFALLLGYHSNWRDWERAKFQYVMYDYVKSTKMELPKKLITKSKILGGEIEVDVPFLINGRWRDNSKILYEAIIEDAKKNNLLPENFIESKTFGPELIKTLTSIYEKRLNRSIPDFPEIDKLPQEMVGLYYRNYLAANSKKNEEEKSYAYYTTDEEI